MARKKYGKKKKEEIKPQETVTKSVDQNEQKITPKSVVQAMSNKVENSTKIKKELKEIPQPIEISSSFVGIHEQLAKTLVNKPDVSDVKETKETVEPDEKPTVCKESNIDAEKKQTVSSEPNLSVQDIKSVEEPKKERASEVKKNRVLGLLGEYEEIKKTEKDGLLQWAGLKYNQESKLADAAVLRNAITKGETISEELHPGLKNKRLGEIYQEYLEYLYLLTTEIESETNSLGF